ncbi:MAG: hypothetical protein ABW318_11280, partial [Vicinamibacterales bacterium]
DVEAPQADESRWPNLGAVRRHSHRLIGTLPTHPIPLRIELHVRVSKLDPPLEDRRMQHR